MDRGRVKPSRETVPTTRIAWLEGRFRVECSGRGSSIDLTVYYGRYVMAQEGVASAEQAWARAAEICRQLAAGELGGPAHGQPTPVLR